MFKKVTKIALAGIIGVGTMVGSSSLVSAKVSEKEDNPLEYTSEARINFMAIDPVKTGPKDPTNLDDEVTPTDGENEGAAGTLTIDYVSNFDFGKEMLIDSSNSGEYEANPVEMKDEEGVSTFFAPYAQVTDRSAKNAGWKLSVSLDEFISEELNKLDGVSIEIEEATAVHNASIGEGLETFKATLNPNKVSAPILKADPGTTRGTFISVFGEGSGTSAEEVSSVGVKLIVPEETRIITGETYTADLTWTLVDGI